MSLRQNSPVRTKDYIGRALRPDGHGGAELGIPAEVSSELDLEPGKDGDLVDMRYDREVPKLEIYFDREAAPEPSERIREELQDLELDEDEIDAIVDRLS